MPGDLLYDADCGFCTRSAHWVVPLGCDVTPVPWQAYDLAEVGLTPARANEQVHLVLDGRLWGGHEAVGFALLTSRRLPVRLLGRLILARPVRPVAAGAYTWVAAHRHRMPGGTPACEMPSSRASTAPTPEGSRPSSAADTKPPAGSP